MRAFTMKDMKAISKQNIQSRKDYDKIVQYAAK